MPVREGVPYAWPRTGRTGRTADAAVHSLCETAAATAASPVERLRLAIDCLPVGTREAMLAGLRANERIIAGAYVDGEGGVCPMLAAHRAGGRTDLLSFARVVGPLHARDAAAPRAATAARAADPDRPARGQPASATRPGPRRGDQRAPRAAQQPHGRRAAAARLPDAADPAGEIVARRLRRPVASRDASLALPVSAGPSL